MTESFAQLFEQSLANQRIRPGMILTGLVVDVTSDVVIVNEALARKYFPDQDPIGQRISIAMTNPIRPTEIVGVVADARYAELTTATKPMKRQ